MTQKAAFWPLFVFCAPPARARARRRKTSTDRPDREKRLAEGKGLAGDCGSEEAGTERWPDEQEADMRRCVSVRRRNFSKPDTCTERHGIDPTGISVTAGAQYPGRPQRVPRGCRPSRDDRMRAQESAEAIGRRQDGLKGRTCRTSILCRSPSLDAWVRHRLAAV